jgi:Phage integrase family
MWPRRSRVRAPSVTLLPRGSEQPASSSSGAVRLYAGASSSTAEQRTLNPQVPGSNPGGRTRSDSAFASGPRRGNPFTYDLVHPVASDTVSHYVRSIASRVGVDTHLHALRPFAATELIGAGHDVRTVAGRLGYRDASVTMKVYSHALLERDRDAAAALGKALTPG